MYDRKVSMKYRLFLTGWVKFRMEGPECFRVLALCSANHIAVMQVNSLPDCMEFIIPYQNKEEVIEFQKKCHVKAVLLAEYGLPFLLQKFRNRTTYLLGMLFAAVIWFYASGLIWNIEIEGNESISQTTIKRFLKEQGITEGTAIRTVETEKLELEMREKFPCINWVSIGFTHTHLTVHISENHTRDYVTDSLYVGGDIVAPCDCVIESMIVRNGTAVVKAGDTVQAGTVMVKGEVQIYNDDGSLREVISCVPDADFLISYSLSIRENLPLLETVKWYTGREKTYFKVLHENEKIFQTNKSNFLYCDQISQYIFPNSIFGYFNLPVKIMMIKECEYLLMERMVPEELLLQKMEHKIQLIIQSLDEKGVQIIEKNGTMDKDGVFVVYKGDWRVQELISGCRPVTKGEEQIE